MDGLCRRVMDGRPDGLSLALLSAQRRLDQTREQYRRSQGVGLRWPAIDRPSVVADPVVPAVDHAPPTVGHHSQITDTTVRLHPRIALAMLERGLAGPGRVWLLLRHLDHDGRGWLPLDQVWLLLATRDAALRVCGRRQLRNLLRQGQEIFWSRDKERIWLRSAARVAVALGIDRLAGRPVALPLAVLLSGIGRVRAHFYASFHSGRPTSGKEPTAAPISRTTLAKITHVPVRTQRLYEQRAGVRRQANFAVGERLSATSFQEGAWRHGRAAFPFIDRDGRQGPPGGRYVAWRLPNSYVGPHGLSPKGRMKKINHQIDLVNSRAQGNDLDRANAWLAVGRLFYSSGQEAGRAYNRDHSHDSYWPAGRPTVQRQRLWRLLPAMATAYGRGLRPIRPDTAK